MVLSKKVVIAFSISFFLGTAYLAFRLSKRGKSYLQKRIQSRFKKAINQSKWKSIKEQLDLLKPEMNDLSYHQLELIDEYVKQGVSKSKQLQLKERRATLIQQGITASLIDQLEAVISQILI